MGQPGDVDGQGDVLKATLALLEMAKEPDTYVELPFEWPETPIQAAEEQELPPIAVLLRKKPWLVPRLYAGIIPINENEDER
jgi:hypothetical protein